MRRLSRPNTKSDSSWRTPNNLLLNLEPADALDHLSAASIRYRIAVGQDAGGRTDSLKNPALTRTDSTPKPFTANQDSFSLNCAVACQPHQRDRLERLCRYITSRHSASTASRSIPPARPSTSSRIPSATAPLMSCSVQFSRLHRTPRRSRAATARQSHPLSRCIRSRLTAQATHRSSRGQTPQAQDQNNTGSSAN